KYASYINRGYSNIRAGQVWVSDHRQLDQAVMADLPDTIKNDVQLLLESQQIYFSNKRSLGKPGFPWITVWRDFLTGKWLAWRIYLDDPNADYIIQSFYDGAILWGLPDEIYIDNGKDYRCKDFAGGKRIFKLSIDETKTKSMMAALNIKVHFAQPYNGQSKPIERDFRNFKDWCDKALPGYRGGNIVERPEVLAENIHRGKLIYFYEYKKLIDFFITDIINKYNSQGKNLHGKSPDQLWDEEFTGLRTIDAESLKMFCFRSSSDLSIGRNGITVNRLYNLYYWSDWMLGVKGRKVYTRCDIKKYQEAWVFDSMTDEYLGKAFLNAWNSNALVKTDLEKKQLTDLLKAKRNEKKIIKSYINTGIEISPREYLEDLSTGIAALKPANTIEQPTEKQAVLIVKTRMDEVIRQEKFRRTGTDNIDFENLNPIKPKKKESRDWFE
ncbi:MAG: transposase domain-containing protein, partial [Ignavibacteriaceae bacterium]|nr:transposase domain-containing protein [Ignavibacteriaceae bacterium]